MEEGSSLKLTFLGRLSSFTYLGVWEWTKS